MQVRCYGEGSFFRMSALWAGASYLTPLLEYALNFLLYPHVDLKMEAHNPCPQGKSWLQSFLQPVWGFAWIFTFCVTLAADFHRQALSLMLPEIGA